MKRSTPKRVYRVEFKVRALAILDANDGCIYRAANQVGVPRSTLRLWRRTQDKIHQQVEETRKQRGLLLEDKFEMMIEELANTMQEKVEKTSLMDSIRGLKLLIELNEAFAAKRVEPRLTRSGVHEKLVRLIDQYARENGTDSVEATIDEAPQFAREI